MDGWRARIGLFNASDGREAEAWTSLLPAGVICAAVPLSDDVERAITRLADQAFDVVGCTAPRDNHVAEAELCDQIEATTGVPTVAALGSTIQALRLLATSSVAVLGDEIDDQTLALSFEHAALDLVAYQPLNDTQYVQPYGVYRAARELAAIARGVDALVLAVDGDPACDVIVALEEDLEILVVSTSQATLWNALRTAGVRTALHGCGQLLTVGPETDVSD